MVLLQRSWKQGRIHNLLSFQTYWCVYIKFSFFFQWKPFSFFFKKKLNKKQKKTTKNTYELKCNLLDSNPINQLWNYLELSQNELLFPETDFDWVEVLWIGI